MSVNLETDMLDSPIKLSAK